MVAKDMQPMTQTSITTLEKALEVAGLMEACALVLVDNSSIEPFQLHNFQTNIPLNIIRLDKNHSFSAASNTGARRVSNAELVLFLNNDVFLHPQALSTMLEDKEAFSASICGARLVYPNGLIQHAGVAFGAGEEGPYHLHHLAPSRIVPRVTAQYQSITGAVMLIDMNLFLTLEGFDEVFPFAYEDTDFCLRAGELGGTTICSLQVDSIHLSGQTRNPATNKFERISRELFIARWGGRVTSLMSGEEVNN